MNDIDKMQQVLLAETNDDDLADLRAQVGRRTWGAATLDRPAASSRLAPTSPTPPAGATGLVGALHELVAPHPAVAPTR